MTTAAKEHDNWDLTSYFDAYDSPSYREFREAFKNDVQAMQERARKLGDLRADNLPAWGAFLVDCEQLFARAVHISSYVGCLNADNAKDETINRERAALQVLFSEYEKIFVLVLAAFQKADDATFDRLVALPPLAEVAFPLRRMREKSQTRMSAELETLAADLDVTGMSAWGRLYDQVSGRLEFDLHLPDGTVKRTPMALKRSLTEDADPAIRKSALFDSNKAWTEVEDVAAAALNSIAGTRLMLYKRRGVKHFLDAALFDSAISRKTLDTMHEVIMASRAIPQKYLRLKAKLIGRPKLGFQDTSAPLPLKTPDSIPWSDAKKRVVKAFGRFYPGMSEFATMSFDRGWVESEVRPAKRQGAFCTSSFVTRESRVFMTYNKTSGDLQTLAHELGHAFHNWVMRDMRPWCRDYPMTLAETASTFAETVLTEAVLDDPAASERDKAVILDTRMEAATAFLLNIPMRYIFERRFYEERAEGEVPVSRIKELMLEAQRETFGDTLIEEEMDPYFWASKLHFYITEVSFYNFPYAFGYLFSLGVFARAKKEGTSFLAKYEQLLRLTGSDMAEGVARRALGVDIEKPDFWQESITLIEADLAKFEEIAPRVVAAG